MNSIKQILKKSFIYSGVLSFLIAFAFSGILSEFLKKNELKKEYSKVSHKFDFVLDDLVSTYLMNNETAFNNQLEFIFEDYSVSCLIYKNKENFRILRGEIENCNKDLKSRAIQIGNNNAGEVLYSLKLDNFSTQAIYFAIMISMMVSFMAIIIIIIKSIENKLLNPLSQIISNVNNVEGLVQVSTETLELRSLIKEILEDKKIIANMAENDTYTRVARQVAHDIKSPLAALEATFNEDEHVNERKEILKMAINRIFDISNSLLKNESVKSVRAENINLLINNILNEKKIILKANSKINILFNSNSKKDLFCNLNSGHFKRIISNLLNNSIDALVDQNGQIIINLSHDSEHIFIEISDNGIGIDPQMANALFKSNITNKKNGQGLGLMHAKTMLNEWGGDIQLKSTNSKGTVFEIILKNAKIEGSQNISSNDFNINDSLVLIDDDELVHLTWKLQSEKSKKKLFIFKDVDSFFKNNQIPKDTYIFIDSNLANGIKGEVESKKIFDAGFTNIMLATGEDLKELPFWIKGQQGKEYPDLFRLIHH